MAWRSKRAVRCASVSDATSSSGSGAGVSVIISQPTGRLGYDRPLLVPRARGRTSQVRVAMTPLLRIVVDHVYVGVNASSDDSIPDHVADDPLQHGLDHDRHRLVRGNRSP